MNKYIKGAVDMKDKDKTKNNNWVWESGRIIAESFCADWKFELMEALGITKDQLKIEARQQARKLVNVQGIHVCFPKSTNGDKQ